MLLSSVALVSKPKNGKNKELAEKRAEKRWINDPQEGSEVTCAECKKEIEEDKFVFQFPSPVPSNESTGQRRNFTDYPGERVTIVTGDALCLSVERFYYTIALREESKADLTCVFRKKVLETKTVPNGRVETVVFALDCDQDFYITTSMNGDLELNYNPSIPRTNEPDERMFDVFFTNLGQVLIQPKLHHNTYLHHLDNFLSIQQLDLNWRCPEEYFFHFNAVPESVSQKKTEDKKVCTHHKDVKKSLSVPNKVTNGTEVCSSESSSQPEKTFTERLGEYGKNTDSDLIKRALDKYAIELPTRKQRKSKLGFSNLFLGCFSAKSHRIVA
ncbi:uncharacterized protein LOC123554332 [Mercenaria mercenaria]|uniref:uncharacterized protein LOC123554332 n=1 Tax=Mercenaria mercenaria TaxID=6596 RepID=UPI00234F76F9|nr:uncharacterized protein LOC123554332 [Mercenaria mercenaria]